LTDFIQILQMFIIWGNDNLSKISRKLERVTWPLPENWHGMAQKGHTTPAGSCFASHANYHSLFSKSYDTLMYNYPTL